MKKVYFNLFRNSSDKNNGHQSGKTLVAFFSILMALVISSNSFAQTNTWDGSTSAAWNTATNWSLNIVPTAAHDVVIPNGTTDPTVNVTTAVCKTLDLRGGGQSQVINISGTNVLTVTGAVLIGAGTGTADDILINVGSGTFSAASVAVTAAGSTNRRSGITLSTGRVNVTGNITNGDVNDDFTFTGAGVLNLGGNMTGGTFTASTGTVNFNGAVNPQIINLASYNFFNIQVNNTTAGGATLNAAGTATDILGALSVQTGTLNNGGFPITIAANRAFSVSNGATFNLTGTTTMVGVSGSGTKTFGATSTVDYAGTTQTVTAETYGNLILSGSGVKTLPITTTTIAGNFTLSGTASATTAAGAINVTGTTIINTGAMLSFGVADKLAGLVNLNGGTLRTGAGAGFNETIGVLSMGASSDITLGTGVHTLTIPNSTAAAWIGTLTINNWGTGTGGRIQVGVGGLTATQLDQVTFDGYGPGATITATGFLVPRVRYKAELVSFNLGSSTWCAGETRNVSISIKNIGDQAWTDAPGMDFNVGVKWNTNGTSWADYHIRTDAANLAPGATGVFTLSITASENVGGVYGSPLALGANNLTFDVVLEGVSWFGDNGGTGLTKIGPGNVKFTSPAQTISGASVNAGAALAAICQGGTSAALGGSVGGTATGGTWTDGGVGGTFNPNATTLNATWTPPVAYTGTATLTLTTTGGSCTPVSASKNITVNAAPTASAGGSQIICQNATATVSGASAANGTIAWTENGAGSITAGANTLTPTYTAAAGDAGNTVTLTMTVSSGSCTPATATYTVQVNGLPTATAGGSASICQIGTATVSGASATNGTIAWTHNGSGSLTNAATTTPTYTSVAADYGNTVVLTMKVTSINACAPATASATYSVFVRRQPTATAGGSATICQGGTASVTGATSSNGTIAWTHNGSGTLTNATTLTPTYTSVAADGGNAVTLTMTVSNSPCTAATATYTVNVTKAPVANAGADQTGATTCNLTTVTLGATAIPVNGGTGTWTIVSGTGGSFGNVNSPTSTFSGTAGTTYQLRWTVVNNPCATATDDVLITFNRLPTPANAGADRVDATTCGTTSVVLGGNTPAVGTGAWSVITGAGGSFSNAANPTATFTGTPGTLYTLRWTISNAPCTASSDDVLVLLNPLPVANAGGNQVICTGSTTILGTTNTASAGTAPYTYAWTPTGNISGSASIARPTTTPITGTVNYSVSVTDSKGCTATSNATVSVGTPLKTWTGIGSTTSTSDDGAFNEPQNWSPKGVPAACNDVVINMDGSGIILGTTALITVSDNTTIKSLSTNLSGLVFLTFTPTALQLFVANNKTLNILNNTNIATNINPIVLGSGATYIGVGNNATIIYGGDLTTTVANSSNTNFPIIATTNNTGKYYINGNANLGGIGSDFSNKPASVVFDGATASTQTITHNSGGQTIYLGGTTTDIGEANSPTVVFAGSGAGGFNVNGNLRVLNASTLDITSTQFLNRRTAGGGFSVNGGATLKLGGTSGGQTGSNFPLNFTAGNVNLNATATPTSTVDYYGGAQTIYTVTTGYGNLTMTNTGAKTATAALAIRKDLTITDDATFGAASFNHNVGGNWINNVGTAAMTFSGTSTIVLNGSSMQDIGGTAVSGTAFNRLTLNNGTGANLSQDQSVANLLTITNGVLNIGSHNLLVTHSAAIGGAPFSTTKMIQADGSGELRKATSGTGAYLYPIGDKTGATDYAPVTVNLTNGGGFGSTSYIGVNVRNVKHPNNQSSAHYLTRYWNVNPTNLTSATATVTGIYSSADVTGTEGLISSAKLSGVFNQTTNGWTKYSTLSANTLTAAGAVFVTNQTNSFSGISSDNPVASIAGGTETICLGESVVLSSTVIGGEPGYTYSWDNAGSLSNSSVANPTATPTTTTTYTLTATDVNGIKAIATKTIIVNEPASITTAPAAAVSTCSSLTHFTVVAAGTGLNYQWQVSTDGVTYNDITGLPYSGFNTNDLSLITPDVTMDGYYYRVIISTTSPCSSLLTSSATRLTIKNVWTGASDVNWNLASNWSGNTLPDMGCATIYIPNKVNKPTLAAGTTSINNLVIYAGALLSVPSGSTLEIGGVLTAAPSSINAAAGAIKMSGTTQTISGEAFTGRTIDTLINNTGTALNISSVANDALYIKGLLAFGNTSADLNTGDNLTLLSTVSGTANLGKVALGNTITGTATSERYINTGSGGGQHPKAWQFVSANTTGSSVKNTWMEAGNPTNGYGVWVTDPTGAVNGFDNTSAGASMKVYNSSNGLLEGIPNTTSELKNAGGYMLYVRGDRTVTGASGPNSAPKPTTLRAKGSLVTGTQTPIAVNAGKLQAIGNPYPSAIDFEKLLVPGGKIDSTFYIWDPTLAGSYNGGGYQTFKAETGWLATPGGGSIYGAVSNYHTIQSGQAFFVINSSATNDNITFTEDAKEMGSMLTFRGGAGTLDNNSTSAPVSMLSTMLFTNAGVLTDGNRVVFNDNYSNAVDGRDANKVTNAGENFGLVRNSKSLAVESRNKLQATDTIYYKVSGLTNQTYKLAFAAQNIAYNNLQAELVDKFDNSRKHISLTDSTIISFQVTSAAASKAADRFMLVFRAVAGPLPVNITSISANRNTDRSIAVNWKTENEINLQKYEVERSADGRSFTGILTAAPTAVNGGSASYLRNDLSPLAADNFYRIKATSLDGTVQYSAIVKVAPLKEKGSIGVYPNPVVNKNVQVQFKGQNAGTYRLQLTNKLGQVVYSGTAEVSGGVFVKAIMLNETAAAGNYQLQVIAEDGTTTTQQVIVQ